MRYSLGLGESSLDHRRREEFPAFFTIVVQFRAVFTLPMLMNENVCK